MDAIEFLQRVGETSEYGRVTVDMLAQGHRLHGKAVVDRFQLDCFAAQLHAAVEAGAAGRDLYDAFAAAFPAANAGRLIDG